MLSRQGDRHLQLGVALFLVTSFEGFVIPGFAAPRLGLSAHSLMALLGVLFIAIGLLWPKLSLGTAASQLAFWLLVYSSLAIVAAYLLGAVWGVATPPCHWLPELRTEAISRKPSSKLWRTHPHRPVLFPLR